MKNTSLKVFLPEGEIKRFQIQDYEDFCKKISTLCMIKIESQNHIFEYLDSENDYIRFSSKEEFNEALMNHTDGVLKVRVQSTKSKHLFKPRFERGRMTEKKKNKNGQRRFKGFGKGERIDERIGIMKMRMERLNERKNGKNDSKIDFKMERLKEKIKRVSDKKERIEKMKDKHEWNPKRRERGRGRGGRGRNWNAKEKNKKVYEKYIKRGRKNRSPKKERNAERRVKSPRERREKKEWKNERREKIEMFCKMGFSNKKLIRRLLKEKNDDVQQVLKVLVQ